MHLQDEEMSQKGFTLIEILAAMAISGMVMTVALLSIYQIVWGTERTNDQTVALTDVNLAALWIKKDLQMAKTTNIIDGDPVPKSTLNLRWVDNTGFVSTNSTVHTSNYTLSGTNLVRNYDGKITTVGRYITSVGFTRNDRIITANITATGSGILEREEILTFGVLTHMRPEEF